MIPAFATFPGENGKIAFAGQSVPGGTFDVFTMGSDGSGLTNLTLNAAEDLDPAWSADGTQIVFRSNRAGNFDIYLMDAGGGGLTRLTSSPARDLYPSLSPDEKTIAFASRRTGTFQVFSMPVTGTDPDDARQLTHFGDFGAAEPQWSPDGQTIAFVGAPGAVFTMRPDGSRVRQLTPVSMLASNPSWSPDGRRIAFVSNFFSPDQPSDVYVMRPNGSQITRLTAGFGNNLDPTWSPDGEEMLFSHYEATAPPLPPPELYEMDADGSGGLRAVTTSSGLGEIGPDWQPLPDDDGTIPSAVGASSEPGGNDLLLPPASLQPAARSPQNRSVTGSRAHGRLGAR